MINERKIACVFHSIDLDGWSSAAVVKKWFEDEEWKNERLSREPGFAGIPINGLELIGYNYGQPIPDLLEYDQIIMCDISFPKEVMEALFDKFGSNLIWIDHHVSAIKENGTLDGCIDVSTKINGLRRTDFAACELTWQYFFSNKIDKFGISEEQNPMPEVIRLLGLYDSFRHKGGDEERKVLEFQYGARECLKNPEDVLTVLKMPVEHQDTFVWETLEKGKAIYKFLCTDAQLSYKNGFEIKLIEEVEDSIGKNIVNRRFVCINKERFNPINFGIDYHKDGFDGCACFYLRADGKWSFSFYNDNKQVDCSKIAKQFGGGGHFSAAGCIVGFDELNKVLNIKK